MSTYQVLECEKCKHYESHHQHPNPLAVSTHWCKKCNQEIEYRRSSPLLDRYFVWLPKKCYFNHYFEESEECKKKREEIYESILSCQVE